MKINKKSDLAMTKPVFGKSRKLGEVQKVVR